MKKLVLLLVFALFFPISVSASISLDQVNQKVCNRLEEDVLRLAAIMDEQKRRLGITETRVAFGGSDTPIKQADYWVNFAAEALAFQRIQKYSSKNELRYSLETLRNKVLQAKNQVRKALENE